jgi:hypothetical protein
MNERIVAIMDQALDHLCKKYDDQGVVKTTEAYNMFAELIIKECCVAADDWYQNHNDIHWDPAQHIRNYFGVE